MPSSSRAQTAPLLFLGLALFWNEVCLGLLGSIVWLLQLFGSFSTLFSIFPWLLLWEKWKREWTTFNFVNAGQFMWYFLSTASKEVKKPFSNI
jgi:hypothetical protein